MNSLSFSYLQHLVSGKQIKLLIRISVICHFSCEMRASSSFLSFKLINLSFDGMSKICVFLWALISSFLSQQHFIFSNWFSINLFYISGSVGWIFINYCTCLQLFPRAGSSLFPSPFCCFPTNKRPKLGWEGGVWHSFVHTPTISFFLAAEEITATPASRCLWRQRSRFFGGGELIRLF